MSCITWYRTNAERLAARRRARIAEGKCGACGLRPFVRGHTECYACHGEYRT